MCDCSICIAEKEIRLGKNIAKFLQNLPFQVAKFCILDAKFEIYFCKKPRGQVNARLMWLVEKDKLLMPEQAGFRQLRSAEDQLAYISQMIEDGFQEKKHTVAVWIDMEKAFDKVWTEGLVNKLNNINISHKMLHWIKNYIKNR